MLKQIRKRILILDNRYKKACQGLDEVGNPISKSVGLNTRWKAKQDLNLLKLLEHLLLRCTVVKIDDDCLIDGFLKLVEPVERHRWKKLK